MKTPQFLRRRTKPQVSKLQDEASTTSSEPCPQVFTEVLSEPFVRGFMHRPTKPNGDGLVLTHGAGSNCQTPLLIAVADSFCGAGYAVLRCDLPFRQDRPYGPPAPGDGKRDRAGLRNAVGALRNEASGKVFIGGHSYGGRQASMLCAEQPDLASGLLLLSYPLHPPRKPDQLRTQHFFNLRTPVFLVQGTRDLFGSIKEMEQALKLIPAKTKLFSVDAGHDLGFKGKATRADLPKNIFSQFQAFYSD